MSNLAKSFITSIFLVIIFIVFFNLDVYGNESVIVSLVFAFIIGFVYLGYSLYKVFEENNAKSKFAVYLSELITSIILFTCVFTVSIGDSDKKFHSLTFLFILAVILIIHSIYGFIKDIEKITIKEFFTQNVKKIAIIVCSIIVVSIPITIHVLTQPLELYYKTEKYGNFYVESSRDDRFFYTLTFKSDWYLEPWRANLLRLVHDVTGNDDEIAAHLVINDKKYTLKTHIETNEPLIITLRVPYEHTYNAFEYHKWNKIYKLLLEENAVKLELNKIFERPKD